VHNHRAVMRGQFDDLPKEIQIHGLRGRVVRKRNENHFRLPRGCLVEIMQAVQELGRGRHRNHAGVALRHGDAPTDG